MTDLTPDMLRNLQHARTNPDAGYACFGEDGFHMHWNDLADAILVDREEQAARIEALERLLGLHPDFPPNAWAYQADMDEFVCLGCNAIHNYGQEQHHPGCVLAIATGATRG